MPIAKTEQQARDLIKNLSYPLKIDHCSQRSLEQNALSHKWYQELATQRPERTAAGWKRFCKLEYGCPILCEDEEFAAWYAKVISPLPYEDQITAMKYVDVTSIMSIKQMSQYMNNIFWAFNDVNFTNPEQRYR